MIEKKPRNNSEPISRRSFLKYAGLTVVSLLTTNPISTFAKTWSKPNVLFVICDDLNDYVTGMGGHPQAKTPNIERLMRMGTSFTNAHTNHPVCAPSRASLFSGLYPHTSGLLMWGRWSNSKILKNSVSLFQHFKRNGYDVYGTGKLHHYNNDHQKVWVNDGGTSNFGIRPSHGPFPWDGITKGKWLLHPSMHKIENYIYDYDEKLWRDRGEHSFGPLSDIPEWKPNPKKGIPGYKGWTLFGKPFRYISDEDRDLMPDELSANWAIEILKKERDKPFFLGIGFMRPHTPLYVPKKYFDMYPLEDVQLPPYKEDDLEDCKEFKSLIFKYGFQRHDLYLRLGGEKMWKQCVQAYLASVTFMDEQLGKILDALEQSPYANNTIILFTSDHGFHLGEKNYNFKLSNWEESTRIPFILVAPGISKTGTQCDHPISLIDVYSTLVDLCGLPKNPNAGGNNYPLDGHSLRPFLVDPENGTWDGPLAALTVIYNQKKEGYIYHYSIRSERWRYTLYSNNAEELYDHAKDPHEWYNMAEKVEYTRIKKKLKNELLTMIGRKP
jgi:arylsulfatase A-like enzyme